MKTYIDCIPCFFKQAIEASRLTGASAKTQKKIIGRLAKEVPKFPLSYTPPEMGRIIYRIVREVTGKNDPYIHVKRKSNRLAMGFYKHLKNRVAHSHDKLLTAIELAIAGNIIDYGVKNTLNVNKEITRILNEENKIIRSENKNLFNYKPFKSALLKAKKILYLGDNSGEIVFDRVLIEHIASMDKNKSITYVVRSNPIINDVLIEDAYTCGINKIARIITSGLDAPGTILKLCSKELLSEFNKSDMIISKGQGNYESLSQSRYPVFFLFMAKCTTVARHLKCNLRDIVLLKNTTF